MMQMAYRFQPHADRDALVRIAVPLMLVAASFFVGAGVTGFFVSSGVANATAIDEANAKFSVCSTELEALHSSFEKMLTEVSLCQNNASAYRLQLSDCQNGFADERTASMLCQNNMTQAQSEANRTIAQLASDYNALARNLAARMCCAAMQGPAYYYIHNNTVYCSSSYNGALGMLPLDCQ